MYLPLWTDLLLFLSQGDMTSPTLTLVENCYRHGRYSRDSMADGHVNVNVNVILTQRMAWNGESLYCSWQTINPGDMKFITTLWMQMENGSNLGVIYTYWYTVNISCFLIEAISEITDSPRVDTVRHMVIWHARVYCHWPVCLPSASGFVGFRVHQSWRWVSRISDRCANEGQRVNAISFPFVTVESL